MIKKERLYDAFGELINAIAMADGEVQEEEVRSLERHLNQHPWAKEIKWSFNYENEKQKTVEESYNNAIGICMENGPDPEYKYLLDVMTSVASSFGGIVPQEKKILDDFRNDLLNRFVKDLEDNKLAYFSDDE
jgi:tellurite resistance protein